MTLGMVTERARWLVCSIVPLEPAIRRWLGRRTDGFEIDDIIQDMYVRLAALDDVGQIRSARQYAFQVARSIVQNQRRHRRTVPMMPICDDDDFIVVANEPSPEQQLLDRDELRSLLSSLAALPDRCRDTLLMRKIEGLSQRQVAERLQISEKAVEKHMMNGMKSLRLLHRRGEAALMPASDVG